MSNNQGVWCSKCYGDHYTNDCPDPVAPVEAKEKRDDHQCTFLCMTCEACPECEGCEHVDKKVWPAPPETEVAETKPTPSTPDPEAIDIAVLSTAFHNVLADFHHDDTTFQETKAQYLRAAIAENGLIEALLPHFEEIAGMETSEPQPDSCSIPEVITEEEAFQAIENHLAAYKGNCDCRFHKAIKNNTICTSPATELAKADDCLHGLMGSHDLIVKDKATAAHVLIHDLAAILSDNPEIRDICKPQLDPGGTTFEEWWATDPIWTTPSCLARLAWEAAKGQSNGR